MHALPPWLVAGCATAWAHAPPPMPCRWQLACHSPLAVCTPCCQVPCSGRVPHALSRALPCFAVGSHGLSGATPWAHAPPLMPCRARPCLGVGSHGLASTTARAVACHTMHWAVSQARIAAIPPCCHGMGCGACELSYPYSLASNGLATMTWRAYAIIAIPCPWALGTPSNPSMPQNSDNQILAIAWDMHLGTARPSVPQHSVTYRSCISHRPTPRGVSHHFPSRRTAVPPVPERTSGVSRGKVIEWDLGGGTNRSDAGLNLSGSWQQGHSATYNTPSRI